jgi:hypothetical protein
MTLLDIFNRAKANNPRITIAGLARAISKTCNWPTAYRYITTNKLPSLRKGVPDNAAILRMANYLNTTREEMRNATFNQNHH